MAKNRIRTCATASGPTDGLISRVINSRNDNIIDDNNDDDDNDNVLFTASGATDDYITDATTH